MRVRDGIGVLCCAAGASLAVSAFAGQSLRIDTEAEARAYVDRVFHENGCRMRLGAFQDRMAADGVAPTDDDMAHSLLGTDKIVRRGRVMSAVRSLVETGGLREDESDARYAISAFGRCA